MRGEMGHIMITVLGMVAQMERRFIKERQQRDGIEKAKAQGIYRGGQPRLDRKAIEAMSARGTKASAIAKAMGCSRMQVYRILKPAI